MPNRITRGAASANRIDTSRSAVSNALGDWASCSLKDRASAAAPVGDVDAEWAGAADGAGSGAGGGTGIADTAAVTASSAIRFW